MRPSSSALFLVAVSLAAAGAIAGGLMLLDSPAQERLRRLDMQRMSHLQQLSMSVGFYFKAHDHLPERLDQLDLNQKDIADPVSGQPYEYKAKDAASYELCAVFDRAPGDDDDRSQRGGYNTCAAPWWKHGAGRTCFTIYTKACK